MVERNLPNVIFISLDATRFDTVWATENESILPFLNGLKGNSHHFTRAYSCSPWTPPAHASMFTGLYPHEHGVQEGRLWLPDELETVAAYLGGKGYHTLGISSNPILGPITNLSKDFSTFYELWKNPQHVSTSAQYLRFDEIILGSQQVVEEMLHHLDDQRSEWSGEPMFLFAQFIGPHNPYDPGEEARQACVGLYPEPTWEYVERINRDWRPYYAGDRQLDESARHLMKDLYRAELYDLDRGLARFFNHPWIAELRENANVIITADHGEMLGELGHIHHLFNLYEPLIHIPLLWQEPGMNEGRVHEQLIQHTALFPVLKRLLGGENLEGALSQVSIDSATAVLREPVEILQGLAKVSPEATEAFREDLVALRGEQLKFIWHSRGRHEAYQLDQDPLEEQNLYLTDPERFDHLKEQAAGLVGEASANDMLQRMKDLGYY